MTIETLSWQALNWADFAVIAVIAFSALISLVRGFTREVISLLTWVLATVVAMRFAHFLAEQLSPIIKTGSLRLVASFLLLFLLVLVLGWLLNAALAKLFEHRGLSLLNRLLGMVFGAARGGVLVAILILVAQHTAVVNDAWYQNARLLPFFKPAADYLSQHIPSSTEQLAALWQQGQPDATAAQGQNTSTITDNKRLTLPPLKVGQGSQHARASTNTAKDSNL